MIHNRFHRFDRLTAGWSEKLGACRRNEYVNLIAVIAVLAACLWLLSQLTGCAMDPVTRGEQVERLGDSAMAVLWQFDDENRALMRSEFPAIHAFAEQTRRTYDAQWQALNAALTAYEATGTAEDAATLKGASDAVATLADQARAYLIQLQAKHPDKVAATKANAAKAKVNHGTR